MWFGRTGPAAGSSRCKFDDPDVPEEDLRFGAGTATDLTWKQVLDTFSCTECGRCQDACPAFATGKILSPKLVIMGLRDQVFAAGRRDAARPETRCPADIGLGLRDVRRVRRRRARSRSSTSTTSSTCAATW